MTTCINTKIKRYTLHISAFCGYQTMSIRMNEQKCKMHDWRTVTKLISSNVLCFSVGWNIYYC